MDNSSIERWILEGQVKVVCDLFLSWIEGDSLPVVVIPVVATAF